MNHAHVCPSPPPPSASRRWQQLRVTHGALLHCTLHPPKVFSIGQQLAHDVRCGGILHARDPLPPLRRESRSLALAVIRRLPPDSGSCTLHPKHTDVHSSLRSMLSTRHAIFSHALEHMQGAHQSHTCMHGNKSS